MERRRRNHSPVRGPPPRRRPAPWFPYRPRPVPGFYIDGFATAWLTPAAFPKNRAYGQVAAQLGPGRVKELLVGALEIDELAVRPYARGRGTGRALLTEITADAPDRRAWLLTSRLARDTVATYRRLGWHEVAALPGTETGVIVFLAPDHPSR